MSLARRLDHVAVLVRSTDAAVRFFSERLGLAVVHSEEIQAQRVRLTYLDAGNILIQLVEPLADGTEIAQSLADAGEGLHHLCFAVDDVVSAAVGVADDGAPPVPFGTGRGRVSAFVAGPPRFGVRLEVTEFRRDEDVGETTGWLSAHSDGAGRQPTPPVGRDSGPGDGRPR